MPRDAGPLTVRLSVELGGAAHEAVWEGFVPSAYAHLVDG